MSLFIASDDAAHRRCDFCGRDDAAVDALVGSIEERVHICNDCVGACLTLMEDGGYDVRDYASLLSRVSELKTEVARLREASQATDGTAGGPGVPEPSPDLPAAEGLRTENARLSAELQRARAELDRAAVRAAGLARALEEQQDEDAKLSDELARARAELYVARRELSRLRDGQGGPVPPVLCPDCRFSEPPSLKNMDLLTCCRNVARVAVSDDGFCAWGEPRVVETRSVILDERAF